ncbi:MAG: hypothetical protein AAF958_00825 [Planctomycetota bacterium]
MNMMTRGAEMVARKLGKHASHAMTYRRREGSSIRIVAAIGEVVTDTEDADGFVIRSHNRDALVDAVHLCEDGQSFQPARGDQVIDGIHVYEVIPIGGDPPWRWSDRRHTRLRIHLQYVGTE